MHSGQAEGLDLADLERALLAMDRLAAARLLAGPLAHEIVGVPGLDGARMPPIPVERVDGLLVPALRSIGNAWGAGRVALSQVYTAARLADEIVAGIGTSGRPFRSPAPRIGLAVLEDRHELGKRIVSMTLRAVGYPIHDYGAGISAESLAEHAAADELDILLVSTLMLRSAFRVEALRKELDGLPRRPRIVVGGAPYLFDASLWKDVGADAMGRTASDAIDLVGDAPLLVQGDPALALGRPDGRWVL
ncbi:MAG: cobalamin-dependent protein [Chloroflexota bacterium]